MINFLAGDDIIKHTSFVPRAGGNIIKTLRKPCKINFLAGDYIIKHFHAPQPFDAVLSWEKYRKMHDISKQLAKITPNAG